MTQVYGTLRVAPGDEGALSVVIDAPPMNLIGPELVRDLVTLLGELESGQETRVVVLESADLDAFVARLARRIASFPADGVRTAKRVLNELTMLRIGGGRSLRHQRLAGHVPAAPAQADLGSQFHWPVFFWRVIAVRCDREDESSLPEAHPVDQNRVIGLRPRDRWPYPGRGPAGRSVETQG